jgi:hypothetical protein
MGEKYHEKRVVQQTLLPRQALLEVDQERNLRKGKKGDAQRQNDRAPVAMRGAGRSEEVQQREEVLEETQCGQICGNARHQPKVLLSGTLGATLDQVRNTVIRQDRHEQQQDDNVASSVIEIKGHERQKVERTSPAEVAY